MKSSRKRERQIDYSMSSLTPRLRAAFADAFDKIRSGELKTLIPFLCLFRLNGKPMNLRMHYQFSPMFSTVLPGHQVFMCGRQLGKSYSICADMLLRSMLIPYYHTLVVQPRMDQIQRLVSTIYKPLLASCPLRGQFISNLELSKLALREFYNGSLCYAEHSYADQGSRLRGISGAASCTFDECQDLEYETLDIGNETMSASLFWGFSRYTGTPKTTDTTLALLWDRSSQAEWVIRCRHCGHFNVPNPEHDLLKMIGKTGPVCARCGGSLNPRDGGFVHAKPELSKRFAGYHISQTIHPLHTSSASKWGKLLDKVNSYTELTLYNEVFGWPYDAATSPLMLSDLVKAQHDLPRIEKPSDIDAVRMRYRYITVAVDWSGGGMISDSYTAYAVLGLQASTDVVDVLYGRRIQKGVSPSDEADEILAWINGVKADAFAYDNGGAGFARLEIMKHRGLMNNRDLVIVPINYVAPHSGDVMKPHTNMRENDLYYYTLDKSRSLAVCIMAIKSCRIRFPKFDESDDKEVARDFLALREDPRTSLRNETVILIGKKPGVPDDFAHAVNFGCSQIWDHFGAYPRIGSRYDTTALDFDENNNPLIPDEVFGPRGDFERFQDAVNMRATTMEIEDFYEDL